MSRRTRDLWSPASRCASGFWGGRGTAEGTRGDAALTIESTCVNCALGVFKAWFGEDQAGAYALAALPEEGHEAQAPVSQLERGADALASRTHAATS